MPINPFRPPTNFDVPTFPLSAARAPESAFTNLASIGDAIGQYRERQQLGELARGATDASGNLDMNKFATAVALSGRDPARVLALLQTERAQTRQEAAQRALEAYHERTATEAERANREQERQRQQQIDQPQQQVVPPTLMSPGYILQMPKKVGEPPIYHPITPPAPATPGPQTALPGGPNLAAAEPNPEEASPYRVAGPPVPPPTAPAPAAPVVTAAPPVTTPARNEAILQRLPPAAQTIVKGVAEYEIDPATLTGKDREEVIAAAKLYRPDYSMAEYQKRGTPPSGEVASRIGLAKAFIERTPQIRDRLQGDELNSAEGRGLAMLGQGGPGELRRAIDEGSEALLRGLTGAGMSQSEATNYARRYQFSLIDTKETQLRKLNELENALRYVTTEVGKGRGGEDIVKGFTSQFGKPVTEQPQVKKAASDAEVNKLIGQARAALGRDPSQRDAIIKRLGERLPQGVDPRLLLGQ